MGRSPDALAASLALVAHMPGKGEYGFRSPRIVRELFAGRAAPSSIREFPFIREFPSIREAL